MVLARGSPFGPPWCYASLRFTAHLLGAKCSTNSLSSCLQGDVIPILQMRGRLRGRLTCLRSHRQSSDAHPGLSICLQNSWR